MIEFHQRSLEIGDGSADLTVRSVEGNSLCNIGHAYKCLGKYLDFLALHR